MRITNHIQHALVTALILLGLTSHAQQDPQYTQYMYNMSVINPAYVQDDPDVVNLGTFFRSQWVGSVGGPTTGTFFAHTPLARNMEGGLTIVHDQIGDVVKETNAFADYAYILRLNDDSRLSFGIKAGATFFSTDFNGFVYSDPLPDPAFAENISRTFPNIGTGVFYFTDTYYLGLSAPNLLKTRHLEEDSGIIARGAEELHFFFTGGYVFNVNEKLKIKPAFMARAVSGAPVAVDLTANALFNEKFEVGIAYRFGDAFSGLANFAITPGIRVGYAYDYTVSNLGRFNSGTHEIMLLFDISRLRNGYDKSPRFF